MQDDLTQPEAPGVEDSEPAHPQPHPRRLQDFRLESQTTKHGLLPAEELLLSHVAAGKECNLTPSELGELKDLADKPAQRIRASFLRFLALGGDENAPVQENGVRVTGAYIKEDLDLQWCELAYPLGITNSWFDKRVGLRGARTRELDFCGSRVEQLIANGARVAGDVGLATRDTDDGKLGFGFFAERGAELIGIEISGALACYGGSFNQNLDTGTALDCQRARIGGSVYLRQGFHAEGQVDLHLATIGGELDCSKGTFKRAGKGYALDASNSKVTGDVQLSKAAFTGGVRLVGAELDQDLNCTDSRFENCEVDGQTIVEQSLDCLRARMLGDVIFRSHFRGTVRLRAADIKGNLYCDAGSITRGRGQKNSLDCQELSISNVFFRKSFKSEGQATFQGARIAGDLDFTGGTFKNLESSEGVEGSAINLGGAKVGGGLRLGSDPTWQHPAKFEGSINLQQVSARTLVDFASSWPSDKQGVITLDGLVYDRFGGTGRYDAATRKAWLRRQPPGHLNRDFRPQPFEQLIKVLRSMGHENDADEIAIFKHRHLVPVRARRAPWLVRPLVWAGWRLYGGLTGYGYRPLRLLAWLVILWLGCAGLYSVAAEHGMFVPIDPQIWLSGDSRLEQCRPPEGNWTTCPLIGPHVKFSALAYSADVQLPVIDLRQRTFWAPGWQSREVKLGSVATLTVHSGEVQFVVWTQNILGSLGALLLGAILAGIVAKE